MDRLVSEAGFAAGLGFVRARPTSSSRRMPSAVRRGSNRWCTVCGRVAISTSTTSRASCRGSKRPLTSASISTRHNAGSRAPSRVTSRTTRFQPALSTLSPFEPRATRSSRRIASSRVGSSSRARSTWRRSAGCASSRAGRTTRTWPRGGRIGTTANVLLLAYEQMKDDHEEPFVASRSSSASVTTTNGSRSRCQESSLASMKAHHDKYDDLLMRERSEAVCDLPLGSDSGKVRSGEVGAHRVELRNGS